MTAVLREKPDATQFTENTFAITNHNLVCLFVQVGWLTGNWEKPSEEHLTTTSYLIANLTDILMSVKKRCLPYKITNKLMLHASWISTLMIVFIQLSFDIKLGIIIVILKLLNQKLLRSMLIIIIVYSC